MHIDLIRSISHLYDVFEPYKARNMQGSPLYGDLVEKWNRQLLSKPMRDLDQDDLSLFAGKAVTTWGTVIDFKHFLPRILELIAENRDPCAFDFFVGKLHYTDWKSWNKKEVDAIETFLFTFFSSLVHNFNQETSFQLDDYFFSILYTCCHPEKYLKTWEEDTSFNASLGLSMFIQEHEKDIFSLRANTYYQDRIKTYEHTSKLIREWFISPSIISRLENAVMQESDSSLISNASWAFGILEKYITQD